MSDHNHRSAHPAADLHEACLCHRGRVSEQFTAGVASALFGMFEACCAGCLASGVVCLARPLPRVPCFVARAAWGCQRSTHCCSTEKCWPPACFLAGLGF